MRVIMKELNYYANLAKDILGQGTKYLRDKLMISDIFQIKKFPFHDTIILRLTIIDSYYSTQMNKRFFGIEEIAENILNVSENDDDLIKRFINFIDNPNEHEEIKNLFNSLYGYRKTGQKIGKAPSIISKYAYFLTEFSFPIYDNLVKKSYYSVKKLYPDLRLSNLPDNSPEDYFQKISYLNQVSKINNFDKLDNLLWLYGKMRKGSFSLILNQNNYLKLVEKIDFNSKLKSTKVDEKIRKYIKNNIRGDELRNIFPDNMIEFIDFCYSN